MPEDPKQIDPLQALAEFARWARARGLEEDDERAFYGWLPRWYAAQGDRALIIAAWDAERSAARARREVEEAARLSTENAARAAEAEQLRARLDGYRADANPPLTAAEDAEFTAWAARLVEDRSGRIASSGDEDGLYPNEVVDHWRTKREQAARKAEQQAQDAERREREAAEQKAATRAALRERLADPAWVRGEDPASLRAVVAWYRLNAERMTFQPRPGPAVAALAAAGKALDAEVKARAAEIATAVAVNQDLGRAHRGEPAVPVPSPLELRSCIDEDALARWLVAHREDLAEFIAGRAWWQTVRRDDVPHRELQRERPHGWHRVIDRCTLWATRERFEAAGAGEAWLAFALDGYPTHDDRSVAEAFRTTLEAEWPRWRFEAEPPAEDDDEEAEEPRTATSGRKHASARVREASLRRRIEDFVRKFHAEHNGWPSKNEIKDGVTGQTARIFAEVDAMVADGVLQEPDQDHAGYWLDG